MESMTYYVAYQWNSSIGATGFGSSFLEFPNEVPLGKGLVQVIQRRVRDILDGSQPGEHSVVVLNMTRLEGP